MKRTLLIVGLFVVLGILIVAFVIGCQSATSTATTTTSATTTTTTLQSSGAVMRGVMQNAVSAASVSGQGVQAFRWHGETPCNSAYTIVITTPESYAAGLYRVRFFKGLDDTTPYQLFSWADPGDTPEHFELSATATQMAINTDYPTAGAYTHMVPTLAYLQQTLPSSLVSFEGMTKFRAMVGEYGDYQRGDLLVSSNEVWYWIDSDTDAFSTTRPSNPVLVDWGSDGTVEVDGYVVFEPTDVSMDSFVIPDDPSGVYTFTMAFDVALTFAFNDVNDSAIFEPRLEHPLGDKATASQEAQYGRAEWSTGPPDLSISVTTSEAE